ncbi:MAG: hypothetical protein PQJ58_20595 [Spirochaetales bacterium]|nr:hypothetical protein [Spirochaetales bacterium]
MLLIHPPAVRNCEPPVALLKLAGALRAAGDEPVILDGAVEAFEWLGNQPPYDDTDKRARRVRKNRNRIISSLTGGGSEKSAYESPARYTKQVGDLNYMVSSALDTGTYRITAADFEINGASPLNRNDLIHAWNHPEESPFFPWFEKRLTELQSGRGFSHMAVSVGYLSQALTGMAITGYIRKKWPQVRVQLGGSLITSWLRGINDCSFLNDLAHEVQEGAGEQSILRFRGLEWKGNGLPDPGDLYSLSYIAPGPILPYSASYGCSWKRCTFCNERWEDNPFKEEAAGQVSRNLAEMAARHEPALIHICDSEISLDLMKALISTPPGAPWYSFSRFFKELKDPVFCGALARSGCRMLCLGLESGDQDVLNALQKGIRLDDVRIILENLKQTGIGTFVYVMFGTSTEDRSKALRTRDFLLENRNHIDFINAAVFSMPAGSRELEALPSRPFYKGDLSLYRDFEHPLGFGRREVREFMTRDLQGCPEIREILNRTPPIFTSSHAPFFIR